MSAVLLALFKSYPTADQVRTALVQDGFPTDRVDLCCGEDLGRANVQPGPTARDKVSQYFTSLFDLPDEHEIAGRVAARVEAGACAVVVHPRGAVETQRAAEIFKTCGASEVAEHDLAHQQFEFAAASRDGAWARNFWIEDTGEAHCIYCRLFPGTAHT
jgi:hypothetical protein